MDDKIRIDLKGSGKTTRIIKKAIELLKNDKDVIVLVIIDTEFAKQRIKNHILKEIDNEKLYMDKDSVYLLYDNEKKERLRFIKVISKNRNDNWYFELDKYCEDIYKGVIDNKIKILVDSDVLYAIRLIVGSIFISKYIEIIEIPIEILIGEQKI